MKNSIKTYLGAGAMVLSLVATMPLSALANNKEGGERGFETMRSQSEIGQTVQVGPKGEVTLRGTVGTVGATSITVKSWGGDWAVNVGTGVKLNSRANDVIALADIKAGDVVMVQGDMKAGAGLTVDARQIKDHRISDSVARVRGTIASIGANTLTVKNGDVTWTVNTAATTKFAAKFEGATTLAAMKVGDEVMAKGVLVTGSTTTLNATEVKDVSLQLTGEKPKKIKMDDKQSDDRGGRKNR